MQAVHNVSGTPTTKAAAEQPGHVSDKSCAPSALFGYAPEGGSDATPAGISAGRSAKDTDAAQGTPAMRTTTGESGTQAYRTPPRKGVSPHVPTTPIPLGGPAWDHPIHYEKYLLLTQLQFAASPIEVQRCVNVLFTSSDRAYMERHREAMDQSVDTYATTVLGGLYSPTTLERTMGSGSPPPPVTPLAATDLRLVSPTQRHPSTPANASPPSNQWCPSPIPYPYPSPIPSPSSSPVLAQHPPPAVTERAPNVFRAFLDSEERRGR